MTVTPGSVLQDSTQFLRRGHSKALRQWQRLPLMDRWLFGELLGPLLFGVAALCVPFHLARGDCNLGDFGAPRGGP